MPGLETKLLTVNAPTAILLTHVMLLGYSSLVVMALDRGYWLVCMFVSLVLPVWSAVLLRS